MWGGRAEERVCVSESGGANAARQSVWRWRHGRRWGQRWQSRDGRERGGGNFVLGQRRRLWWWPRRRRWRKTEGRLAPWGSLPMMPRCRRGLYPSMMQRREHQVCGLVGEFTLDPDEKGLGVRSTLFPSSLLLDRVYTRVCVRACVRGRVRGRTHLCVAFSRF